MRDLSVAKFHTSFYHCFSPFATSDSPSPPVAFLAKICYIVKAIFSDKVIMRKNLIAMFALLVLSASVLGTAVFAGPAGFGGDWRVVVSVDDQKTYVFQKGSLVREMICSTGLLNGNYDTPLGDYILNESGQKRGTYFYSKKFGAGAKWWVGFIGGTWLFHSLATDEAGNIIQEEAAKLGRPASHGCIRLSMENSKWFYDTVPDGAKVHIQKEAFLK